MESREKSPILFSIFGPSRACIIRINKCPVHICTILYVSRAINNPRLLMEDGLCFFKGSQVVERDNRADDEINTV